MSAVLHFHCKILLSHILLHMMSPVGPRCHQLLRTGGLFAKLIRLRSAKPCPSPLYFPTSPRPHCPVLFTENPGQGKGGGICKCTLMLHSHSHKPMILSRFVPKFTESTAPLEEGPDSIPFCCVSSGASKAEGPLDYTGVCHLRGPRAPFCPADIVSWALGEGLCLVSLCLRQNQLLGERLFHLVPVSVPVHGACRLAGGWCAAGVGRGTAPHCLESLPRL